MTQELLPCPFCGAAAEMCHSSSWAYFARCTNKSCAARTRTYQENERGARDAWNQRCWPTCSSCRHLHCVKDGADTYCDRVHQLRDATDYCSKWEEAVS
ncbi:MAG: Lar family restriction alleviation protein [Coriobacteriales bacterium]|nr:Lar family restriction alleviation protein [Coriobacteriales bacterium]